ncbi:odorant receptor Or2-like isoform X3 [Maniola hyperantus]|uniref:odorant receptor Or2-like isoform X3 n=1 Tax=Aphantopus hyperantus TaxID=2795564 RepID=UPI001569B448|nr:odorant receptor 22c-like [Maniola hyperantus]
MLQRKIITSVKGLEDPKYPLLGPTLKGLYWFGLWQCGHKIRDGLFNFLHLCSLLFVVSEFIELYFMRNDLMKVLFNMSLAALSLVSISKTVFFILYLPRWRELVRNISTEEIAALNSKDPVTKKLMKNYIDYSRVITFLYWSVILLTNLVTISSPFIKYATAPVYREMIRNGSEPYPQILSSWFPFDKTKMPGYLVAVTVHIIMTSQGAGVVGVYDTNAVAIMSFLKGQMMILRHKSQRIFGEVNGIPRDDVLDNIKECHRLHNLYIEQYKIFNSIISPVMFIYVLVCSITICCSVVQLSLGEITMSQKLWVIEFTMALAVQLLLYCWHSNEIAYESHGVDRGVYSSNWWRGDVQVRRQVLLLAGKLSPSFILQAGPFTNFSMATFIDILKGSYSFYTLFTQMQENKI